MTLDDAADPISAHVSDFKRRHVLVLGDAILDEYLTGECSRISPEAPVPVLRVTTERAVLGGAANTAANIVSLGGRATLVALVGADAGGSTLQRCARDAGVELVAINHGLSTLRKSRVVSQQQQIVRLDYEDPYAPSAARDAEILAEVHARSARATSSSSPTMRRVSSRDLWPRRSLRPRIAPAVKSSSIPGRNIAIVTWAVTTSRPTGKKRADCSGCRRRPDVRDD
jgi:hypothetical protein